MLLYSISKAAEKTSISSYTLRYYEKIGLLPPPKRKNSGRRFYTETDIQFMLFLKSLKETGMSWRILMSLSKTDAFWKKSIRMLNRHNSPHL